jgi:hypothetical protein
MAAITNEWQVHATLFRNRFLRCKSPLKHDLYSGIEKPGGFQRGRDFSYYPDERIQVLS